MWTGSVSPTVFLAASRAAAVHSTLAILFSFPITRTPPSDEDLADLGRPSERNSCQSIRPSVFIVHGKTVSSRENYRVWRADHSRTRFRGRRRPRNYRRRGCSPRLLHEPFPIQGGLWGCRARALSRAHASNHGRDAAQSNAAVGGALTGLFRRDHAVARGRKLALWLHGRQHELGGCRAERSLAG